MNNTRAELVIIHALWPGPEVADVGVTKPSGTTGLPSLSLAVLRAAVGSPLLTYASSEEMRCSSVGVGAGAAAAASPSARIAVALNINMPPNRRPGMNRFMG